LWGAHRLDPLPAGLTASYFSTQSTSPAPAVTTIDEVPSTDAMQSAWHGTPRGAFRATWRGTIFVPNDGAYTFATRSDGESSLYLDGRMVLENGGAPGMPLVSGSIRPDRGTHTIAVNYVHNGGTPAPRGALGG
jgi:hypothetical protein